MLRFVVSVVIASALVGPTRASAQRFVEVGRMPAGASTTTGPTFGTSVALDGTTAVIGAPQANGGAGAIYVFDVTGGVPTQLATTAPTGVLGLGAAVAVRGSVIVAGAPHTLVEGRADVGAVVVFQRSGAAVTEVRRFGLPDANADGGALFGQALAFSGPTSIAVGAPGIRTAFHYSAVTTTPTEVGSVSDLAVAGYAGAIAVGVLGDGTAFAAIGSGDRSVAADVDLWIVGPGGVVSGTIENEAGLASFGSALAIDGTRVAVGIPGRDEVKIFLVDPATGSAAAIEAYGGPPSSGFGASVALHGELAFGGAPAAGALFGDAGEAYSLRTDTLFPLRPAIRTTLPFVQDLGASMSLSGPFLLVGAPGSGGDAILFGNGAALPCTLATDCPIAEACIDGVCCQSTCGIDPTDCQTCASTRAPGWCVLEEVGTACASAGGTCSGTCSGESSLCEPLECVDGGSIDAGSDDGGAQDGAAPSADAASRLDGAPTNVSFSGGGGCRCAAIGAGRAGSLPSIGLALLALAMLRRRRRGRIG